MNKRDYLFKGVSINDNKIVFGSLDISDKSNPKIIIFPNKFINILIDSISEYTNCIDKNGNKIFENDNLKFIGLSNREYIGKVVYFDDRYYIYANEYAYYPLADYCKYSEIVD